MPAQRGVQSAGRFVQKQQLRLAEQRLGEAQALAHALGVGAHPAVGGLVQPDLLEY